MLKNKDREFYNVPDWFYSDGGTCYPDGNRKPAFLKHDWGYWLGGNMIDRENRDEELFHDVENTGGNKIQSFLNRYLHCFLVYAGVKTFGKKPFVERDKKLNENDPELEEIYFRERTDDYQKQIYRNNNRKNKR
jgi:hypothetical protein